MRPRRRKDRRRSPNASRSCAVGINSLAEHQEDYTDLWMKRRLRFRRSSLRIGRFRSAAKGGGCINWRELRRCAALGASEAERGVIKHDWTAKTCTFVIPVVKYIHTYIYFFVRVGACACVCVSLFLDVGDAVRKGRARLQRMTETLELCVQRAGLQGSLESSAQQFFWSEFGGKSTCVSLEDNKNKLFHQKFNFR